MNCLFCDIVAGKIPSQVVREEGEYVAFRDIHPVAPKHVLVVPKRHLANIREAKSSDEALLGRLMLAASEIARQEGLTGGYRLVVNSGSDGGQTVDHLHVHVVGGRRMAWPPG